MNKSTIAPLFFGAIFSIAGAIIEQNEQVVILYQPGELNLDGIQQFKTHSSAEWEFDKINLNYSQVKESI